jgi:hypothetical protein
MLTGRDLALYTGEDDSTVFGIQEHMNKKRDMGDKIYDISDCGDELKKQHPELGNPEMKLAIDDLESMLDSPNGREDPETVVRYWVSTLIHGNYGTKYPKYFEVKPIIKDKPSEEKPKPETSRRVPDKADDGFLTTDDTMESGLVGM